MGYIGVMLLGGYTGVMSGLCWGYIGLILGSCWGYTGTPERLEEVCYLIAGLVGSQA